MHPVNKLLAPLGVTVSRKTDTSWRERFPDTPKHVLDIVDRAKPYTMTSYDCLVAMCSAAEYTAVKNLPGDFVECGVWRGGSSMAAGLAFMAAGRTPALHLFDTYEGMTEPTDADRHHKTGEAASNMFAKVKANDLGWCEASQEDVEMNLSSISYPSEIRYVKGMVEQTIPSQAPEQICLLRLDTDWYESTKHELEHLFPRLSSGGLIIIDDYGHWTGAKKATDEYFAAHGIDMFLNRVDYTCRIGVKR